VDAARKKTFHDDRITQRGRNRLDLFRPGDDPLRNGRDAAGPEDLLREVLVEGAGGGGGGGGEEVC
jgi:hypothetical protein